MKPYRTMLIVDDDPDDRLIIRHRLPDDPHYRFRDQSLSGVIRTLRK